MMGARTTCSVARHATACSTLLLSTLMSASSPNRTQLFNLITYQSTSPTRLKFLYSDFTRHKVSNPSSYASNIEWWRRTLETAVLEGWQAHSTTDTNHIDRLILHAHGPAFAEVFRLEGVGKPIGLAGVIVSPCIDFSLMRYIYGISCQ